MPLAPWDVEDYVARRETWGIAQGPVLVCFEFPGESGPTLNVLDREAHQAFYWVSSARGISFWENAAPLKMILHWWLRDRGLQFLHAGAVGNENGGVLLGGKGGSGKSTTTLLCVGLLQGLNGGSTYGLRYASDDYTVVNQDNPPIAYSLYNAAKLHASHLQKTMPALLPAVSNPDRMEEEKAVLYLKESCPRNLLDKLTIKAILLPTVTGRSRSELKQVSPALGVNAIAPSTLFQMRWSGQEDMSNMVGVIGRVPNYRLELGTDLREIPELIANPSGEPNMKVTAIIPSYNAGRYIAHAIEGIRNQHYPGIEIIVVDDGSTDDTARVVKNLGGVRYEYQENQGPGAARNHGLSIATGDVIAFCDADDQWTDDKLAIQIPMLEDASAPEVLIGHSQRSVMRNENGKDVYEDFGEPMFSLLMGTSLILRRVFAKVGGFPERPPAGQDQLTGQYGEDLDWYLRAKEAGVRIRFHKEIVQRYLRHTENLTLDRDSVALSAVRAMKNSLDRRRAGIRMRMMDWTREVSFE